MQLTLANINQQIVSTNKKNTKYNNISFEMAPGNYLYKDAAKQNKALTKALIPVFDKGSGFATGIENAIKKAFPMFNFTLGNISDLQYYSIKKEQPLVFSRTSFKKEIPQTFLYLNFPEIIEITKSKSARRLEGLSESISNTVTLANEPHFVSKVVDMCTANVNKLKTVTMEDIKKIVEKCLKSYDIKINNVVLNKEDADKISPLARQVKTPVTDVNYSETDVKTKLCIIMEDSDKSIRRAISHEFTHTLNANSRWINDTQKELFSTPDAPVARLDFAPSFVDLYDKNTSFLDMSAQKRGEEYEKILRELVSKVESTRDKKLVINQALSLASDEAHAYSQTPGLFNEYRQTNMAKYTGGSVSIPIGWFYVDFYDFLLSVKNNEALLNSITG